MATQTHLTTAALSNHTHSQYLTTQTNFVFSNSNGVTFGTNGSTVTASVNTNYQTPGAYLTTAALSNHSHNFATTTTNGAVIVVGTTNSNGATVGVPAFLTTAAATNVTTNNMATSERGNYFYTSNNTFANNTHSHGSVAFGGTNISGSFTSASNGLSMSLSAAAPGAGGGVAIKGSGTYTQNTGTVEFANGNGITFGLSNNGTMTASHNGLTTARASNDAIGLNSALTGNGVSVTANSSGLSINVPAFLTTAQPVGAYLTTARASNDAIGLNTALTANGLSVTANSSGLSINVPAWLTTAAATNVTTNNMATSERGNYFYTSNNTFANNTHTHGNPTLALTNLSGTTASASNGFTLSLSAAAPGGGGGAGTNTALNLTNLTGTLNVDTNGISLSLSGNAAGAGGAVPQRWTQIPEFRFSLSNLTNITALTARPFFQPIFIPGTLTLSRVNFEMSRATSGSNAFTVTAGMYTYANDTQLSLLASATGVFSNTATASVSGIRRFAFGGFNVSTFAPGGYVLGMMFNAANTLSMNYSIRGYSGAVQAGAVVAGTDQYNTAVTYNIFPFLGRFSTTTAAFPSSVGDSHVLGQFSGASAPINAWVGFNND